MFPSDVSLNFHFERYSCYQLAHSTNCDFVQVCRVHPGHLVLPDPTKIPTMDAQ